MAFKNRRNFYRILQVQPDAPAAVIKAAYRTLLQKMKNHPDLGGDSDMAALINEAYETVIDPNKRAEYDKTLFAKYSKAQLSGYTRHENGGAANEHTNRQCFFCKHHNDKANPTLCATCNTPLQHAAKTQFGLSDPNISSIKNNAQLFCFVKPNLPPDVVTLAQLSPFKLHFLSPFAYPVGQVIKLENHFLRAAAKIKRCQNTSGKGFEIEVEFLSVQFARRQGNFFEAVA